MLKQRRHYPNARFKPWQYTDFYEVLTTGGTFVVSMAAALHIERCTKTSGDLQWIEFHDLSGTAHRIQARHVARISAHA